jgi:ribosomal protein S27AE
MPIDPTKPNRRRRRRRTYGPDRFVFVERPACVDCGNFDGLLTRKTVTDPDGTVTRYTDCPACGGSFIVVHQPPAAPEGPEEKSASYPAIGKRYRAAG